LFPQYSVGLVGYYYRNGMWFEQFKQDLFFGMRNLARTPAFTAIAIGSLALGLPFTRK
jgi:hypothetical protein